MKTLLIAALLVAVSASAAAPAFAKGYAPAPSYAPSIQASAPQSGLNAQTIAPERNEAIGWQEEHGGVAAGHVHSGRPAAAATRLADLYTHH